MDEKAGWNIDIARFYDELSEIWDKTRPSYTTEVFRLMIAHINRYKPLTILDFGCGTGLLCKFMSENLPKAKVNGIDVSEQMIEKAKSNCPSCNFYIGNGSAIDLGSYDVIVSKDVFNHISDIPSTILMLHGLLNSNDDGLLVIANRERSQDTRERVMSTLESLHYAVSIECYSFRPTKEEVNYFIQALSNFSKEHKSFIKRQLEEPADYYIISAIWKEL